MADVANGSPDVTVNVTVNAMEELTDRQRTVYNIIKQNHEDNVTVNVALLSQKLKVSRRTILRDIEVLTTKSFIRRVGSDKTGHWEPIMNEEQ